jgi:hypothetical protein
MINHKRRYINVTPFLFVVNEIQHCNVLLLSLINGGDQWQ